ncbi:protein phosphatase 2C domain-containing protein [Pseudomonas koreensis]
MRASLQWYTQAGTLTADNRDTFAHVELAHASLYLIADGSSSHPLSGELANVLLAKLVLDFSHVQAAEMNAEQTAEALLHIITASQHALRNDYPRAACSYLVLCLLADAAFSIHEGDCCLGLIEQTSSINWLSSAHCVTNWQGNLTHAEIAQDASRHHLTRCFSARRASNPEIKHWSLAPNQHWLLASDGFWACLSHQEQLTFLRTGNLLAPPTDDDISCLSVLTPPLS